MSDPSSIEARVRRFYGPDAPRAFTQGEGLIHVAAVWVGERGRAESPWCAIQIREHGPRSAADRFALELARARADAIVITGQIVRDEARLSYARPGAGTEYGAALQAWRRDRLGRSGPPWLLILTRRADLDFAHPVFHGWARPLVFTNEVAAAALRRQIAQLAVTPPEVELVGHPAPSLAAALEYLRGLGCRTTTLEAGPSVVAPLYAGVEPAPDELLISQYAGPLSLSLRGGHVADPREVAARFECVSSTVAADERDWTLTRWLARC